MSRIRDRLAGEGGSILVEVLVGTVLLALTTAAVLDGLDGAQRTGLENKSRSTAATLAQQDIERLRSLPPALLVNLDQTRTVEVAGVPYTVVSRAEPVVDASGLVSCTTEETDAEYLRLSSTASAPATAERPVTATSLLAPPLGSLEDDSGTAAVKLTDRDGAPLAGVGVDLVGPSSYSSQTNYVGCAVFAFIAADDWIAEVDGDLVTWNGDSPAQSPVTVAADTTSLTQIELDDPASLRATFVTPFGAPTTARSIGVANAKLANGYRTFPVGDYAASKDAEGLFPFHDGYGVFAGSCEANNPAIWDSDYFETSGYGAVELDPGELLGQVQVVVPQLDVTVERDGDSYADAQIYVQQVDDDYDCEDVVYNSGVTSVGGTSFAFEDIPLPFGRYRVCAATRTSSFGSWRRRFTGSAGAPSNPNLRTPPLERSITIDADGSGSSGCTATPAP
jgi:type II secretory pathway pseudopilin PulG